MSSAFLWRQFSQRHPFTGVCSNLTSYVRYQSTQLKLKLNMNEAHLRYDKENGLFDLSFRYINPNLKLDRQFNFNRKSSETVGTFLKRVNVNVDKSLNKKKNRQTKKLMKKGSPPEESNALENHNEEQNKIALVREEEEIDNDLTCESLFQDLSGVKLIVYDSSYSIKCNLPWVHEISLPKSMLAGFPVYPSKLLTKYTIVNKSDFHWYKLDTDESNLEWIKVGEGYLYVPSISDIGCRLKLKCIPKNDTEIGLEAEVQSSWPVEAGPGHCPFDTRHAFTKDKLSGESFRITSYNILADTYSRTDYSKQVLFSYCPEHALDMDYRKQLLIKELLGFNSDLICLQEVDEKVYQNDLNPLFSIKHYDSVFTLKGGESREGLATFFNSQRFEKLNSSNTIISQNKDLENFSQVWSKITNTNLKKRFDERNTAVQVTVLMSKDDPKKILVIGNTHLYFHPNADQVRLLQGYYVLMYTDKVAKTTQNQFPDSNVSKIICGDFNSVPECGIYQLMTEKYIPEDYKDWSSNSEESVKNVALSHELNLGSACGTPEYTNYTPSFADCLDYIFYQRDNLQVEQVIPMTGKEELSLYGGCPSVVLPSDHISLCADLKWIK